jgi:dienelactone hydrolase
MAAINLLRKRPDIDPKRIGIRGESNGAWVAPIVATRFKDLAFIVVRSGSSLPITENLIYEVESEVRGQGFSEEEVAQAGEIRRLLNTAIQTNTGWDTLRDAAERARGRRWFGSTQAAWVLSRSLPPSSGFLEDLRHFFIFDPQPYWEQVTCPVLALFGEIDRSVPAKESATRLEQFLKKAGNKEFTITIFPKGNHALFETDTGFESDYPRARRLVPAYLEAFSNWLTKYMGASK